MESDKYKYIKETVSNLLEKRTNDEPIYREMFNLIYFYTFKKGF